MEKHEDHTPAMEDRPVYEPPAIRTLSEEEVLERVGPAQAYTGTLPFAF